MGIKKSKFRAESNNVRYTVQLFYDKQIDLPTKNKLIDPMFSLHDDVEGVINFRKEYVKDMDTTGYKTATRLLENYDHWKLLMKLKWFQEAKKEWDAEVAAKMDAEATDTLREIMNNLEGDVKVSEKISAAKTLLGKAAKIGKTETVAKRGRPSKNEVEGELKEQARLTKEEREDLKRIRSVN